MLTQQLKQKTKPNKKRSFFFAAWTQGLCAECWAHSSEQDRHGPCLFWSTRPVRSTDRWADREAMKNYKRSRMSHTQHSTYSGTHLLPSGCQNLESSKCNVKMYSRWELYVAFWCLPNLVTPWLIKRGPFYKEKFISDLIFAYVFLSPRLK